MNKQFRIPVKQLDVSIEDLLKYLPGMDADILEAYRETVDEILSSIEGDFVTIGYKIFTTSFTESGFSINDTIFNSDEEVVKLLKNSEELAVFACTVGETIENELTKFNFQDQMMEAYIADVIGTVLVEKSSGLFFDILKENFTEKSFKTTNTVSPGNCGWDIMEQHKLFGILPPNFLGISLNDSGMMHPAKSLSGVIGLGKKVRFKHSDCKLCNSLNCAFRVD